MLDLTYAQCMDTHVLAARGNRLLVAGIPKIMAVMAGTAGLIRRDAVHLHCKRRYAIRLHLIGRDIDFLGKMLIIGQGLDNYSCCRHNMLLYYTVCHPIAL